MATRLTADGPPRTVSAAHLATLAEREPERRRVSPQTFLARVAGVLDAHRNRDGWVLVGALEDLASASLTWAEQLRARGGLRRTPPPDC